MTKKGHAILVLMQTMFIILGPPLKRNSLLFHALLFYILHSQCREEKEGNFFLFAGTLDNVFVCTRGWCLVPPGEALDIFMSVSRE